MITSARLQLILLRFSLFLAGSYAFCTLTRCNNGLPSCVTKLSHQSPLYGVVSRKWADTNKDGPVNNKSAEEEEEEDPHGYESKPEWLALFPKGPTKPEIERDYPDYANLPSDDPLFLDMPFPTEAGPEASAFGRHLQWRRRLSDGERMRWQKWAIYQRLMMKHNFQYSVDDFIFQNMLRDLKIKADAAKEKGDKLQQSMWDAVVLGFKDEQETEVGAVMKAYYSAFNRKNYDELRTLWLPDENVELIMPGFGKARGPNAVNKLYEEIIQESRPFGSVEASTVSMNANGFIAVVNTVELVKQGTEIRKAKRKTPGRKEKKAKPPAAKRIFATTVLRKWNQQWRIMIHHAVRFTNSAYTGDAKALESMTAARMRKLEAAVKSNVRKEGRTKAERESAFTKELQRMGLPPMVASELQGLLGDGVSLSTTSRMNKDGGWEKVVTVDEDLKSRLSRKNAKEAISSLTAAAILEQLVGPSKGKRLKLGSDGNIYVDTDDDDEQGRNNGGDGGQLKSKNIIDDTASSTKQTVQALRILFRTGSISREEKEMLLLDIIDNTVSDDNSLVVAAFEVLVLKVRNNQKAMGMTWGSSNLSEDVAMKEFAEQCKEIVKSIKAEERVRDRFYIPSRPSRRFGMDGNDDDDDDNGRNRFVVRLVKDSGDDSRYENDEDEEFENDEDEEEEEEEEEYENDVEDDRRGGSSRRGKSSRR